MEKPCEKVDRLIASLEEKKKRGELSKRDVFEVLKKL